MDLEGVDYGAQFSLFAGTSLDFAGDASVLTDGFPGSISMQGGTTVKISGAISLTGTPDPETPPLPSFSVRGCDVEFEPGANIGLTAPRRGITLEGGSITVDAGASLSAANDALVSILYGNVAQPPVLAGSVTPAPTITSGTYGPCN